MAQVTAEMVKRLREVTDLPMMECKQALTENDGDFESAKEWLRKKHKGKMQEREGRETGEGRIGIVIDSGRRTGAIVEMRCETAPVASNDLFISLVNKIAEVAMATGQAEPDPAEILKNAEVETLYTETYGKLRETMKLVRCRRVEGAYLASYVHHDGKKGVLVALDAKPTADAVAPDLCMHIAFSEPLAIDRSGVPQAEIDKVRTLAEESAREEGKNPEIVAKISEGKVNAFCSEKALLEQLHVRSDSYGKTAVGDVLKAHGVGKVTEMVFMKVGG